MTDQNKVDKGNAMVKADLERHDKGACKGFHVKPVASDIKIMTECSVCGKILESYYKVSN